MELHIDNNYCSQLARYVIRITSSSVCISYLNLWEKILFSDNDLRTEDETY